MCHRTKHADSSESKNVAKERLHLMIDAAKKHLDDDTMSQIRHEIGEVITKYVDIEPENIEIKIILRDYTKCVQ